MDFCKWLFNESSWQTADILDSDLTEAIRFNEHFHSSQ
jgi:hypothetical protein